MSTYVLMRILESAPSRYDLGIRLLTLGRLRAAYDRLARRIGPGQRVLDLGCGTGALALCAARRGARVKGIDTDARMLEIGRRRAREAGPAGAVEFVEMGVAELDREPAGAYDAVTSGLCFSELGEAELAFALRQIARILRPGGLLIVADEVPPAGPAGRLVHGAVRGALGALAYLVTQQTTRPIQRLPEKVAQAGLAIVSARREGMAGLMALVACKPPGTVR